MGSKRKETVRNTDTKPDVRSAGKGPLRWRGRERMRKGGCLHHARPPPAICSRVPCSITTQMRTSWPSTRSPPAPGFFQQPRPRGMSCLSHTRDAGGTPSSLRRASGSVGEPGCAWPARASFQAVRVATWAALAFDTVFPAHPFHLLGLTTWPGDRGHGSELGHACLQRTRPREGGFRSQWQVCLLSLWWWLWSPFLCVNANKLPPGLGVTQRGFWLLASASPSQILMPARLSGDMARAPTCAHFLSPSLSWFLTAPSAQSCSQRRGALLGSGWGGVHQEPRCWTSFQC